MGFCRKSHRDILMASKQRRAAGDKPVGGEKQTVAALVPNKMYHFSSVKTVSGFYSTVNRLAKCDRKLVDYIHI